MLPKLKKNIKDFIVSEEGKITKQSLFSIGAIVSSAMIGGSLVIKKVFADTVIIDDYSHNNGLTGTNDTGTMGEFQSTHTHHGSHNSHGSHGSHASS